MDSLDVHAFMNRISTLPLTEVQQYDASNMMMRSKYTTEIHDGITFDFYTGLSYVVFTCGGTSIQWHMVIFPLLNVLGLVILSSFSISIATCGVIMQ